MITKTLEVPCPYCSAKIDIATWINRRGRAPQGGDVCFTFCCGKMAIYNADLSMRIPDAEERLVLAQDPRLVAMQIVWSGTVKPSEKEAQ